MENRPYVTEDFDIATYLYSQGHVLSEINWLTSTKAEFVFENSTGIAQSITKFWNGEAKCSVKDVLQAQRELKRRLYGSKPCA